MRKIWITLLLLIAVLLAIPQAASAADEPTVTITLDKESVEVGEIVTATYRIEGSGDYSGIRWAASMWVSEYENQIIGDSQGELSNLTGSISYAPRFGEALSIGISFEDEAGRTYWFEGERIPITGYTFIEPKVEIQYDRETVAIGENVITTYRIENSQDYTNIRWAASMWVSEYENQITGDGQGELSNLTGSISYAPRFGEALSIGISFEDKAGRIHWFDGVRLPISGYAEGYDTYCITEGQDMQLSAGETSLTFRADGDFEKYLGVQVDGKAVPSKYVKAWSGSTYVELSAEYLASLPEGEHELTIVFDDGVAVTRFATMKSLPEIPQTGDDSSIMLYILLSAICMVCLAAMARKRRTE